MHYDVAIIGGGMVGASLAHALRDTPFNILLVDAMPFSPPEDSRLIALNFQSYMLYQQLGVWEKLAPHACSIREVHVSQRQHFGATRIRAQEINLPVLGYVVPAKFINAALENNLPPNVTYLRPATLKNLTQTSDSIQVELDHKNFSTGILIGADGSHSIVRQLIDIPVKKYDYQQSALVTITHLQRSHQHIAYERFLKKGAIAMLPLPLQRAATIWSGPTEDIHSLFQSDEKSFLTSLQQQFGYRLGRFLKIEKRSLFPLQMQCATEYIKNNIALIGNAAHTVHPIAAQGLNLALHEVALLSNHLHTESSASLSLQHFSLTAPSQQLTLHLSHFLARLFAKDSYMISFIRQFGMIGLDILLPAKKSFAEKTAGKKFLLQNSSNSFEM